MYLAQWGWLGSRFETEGWGYRKCRLQKVLSFFFWRGGGGLWCLTWWGFIFWKGERVCELLQRSSAQLHTLMVMCVRVCACVCVCVCRCNCSTCALTDAFHRERRLLVWPFCMAWPCRCLSGVDSHYCLFCADGILWNGENWCLLDDVECTALSFCLECNLSY